MNTTTNIKDIDFSSLFQEIGVISEISVPASIENQKGNLISRTTRQEVKHAFYSNFKYTISGNEFIGYIVWKHYNNGISNRIYICKTLSEAVDKVNELRLI